MIVRLPLNGLRRGGVSADPGIRVEKWGGIPHFGFMRKFIQALAVLSLLLLAVAGCDDEKPRGPLLAVDEAPVMRLPTRANPHLATIRLWLGAEELITEMALTAEQQMTGMMFRTNMAENAAMIFPLPYTRQASFWMMNCPLTISAAYIDPDGIILEIHELKAQDTNSVVSASENVRFVLETSHGWFERHNVKVGAAVRTEKGSLLQTFFPQEAK